MYTTQRSADSLSSKLAALDLTEDELAVFRSIVSAAASSEASEVVGFAASGAPLTFSVFNVKCDVHPVLLSQQPRDSVVGDPGQTYVVGDPGQTYGVDAKTNL